VIFIIQYDIMCTSWISRHILDNFGYSFLISMINGIFHETCFADYLFISCSTGTMDKGKFLMAARRFRRGPHTEYVISLDADDLSQGSNAYVGKLR
jgi:hypothetical protein